MYVELHPTGLLRLSDPRNMSTFHARVPAGRLALFQDRLGSGGAMEGDGHVWLSPSLIRTLAGPVADESWSRDFERMLAYARRKGWLDALGRIRAHIETTPETAAPTSAQSFKALMRRLPAGVAIVATGQGAERAGLTASSVASVCAEPPTLSVCINREASAYSALMAASHVSFSFLGAGQDDIARRFAGVDGCRGSERFDLGSWRKGSFGQAILAGAAAACECEIVQRIDIGSHTMLIAEVVSVESGTAATLVNLEGRLFSVA
jgi:flavin reductase (DIM6/NTAB) family NADH-FMN oxidoreductase RutF